MTSRLTLKQIETKFRELDEQEGRINQFYDKDRINDSTQSVFKVVGGVKCFKEPDFFNVLQPKHDLKVRGNGTNSCVFPATFQSTARRHVAKKKSSSHTGARSLTTPLILREYEHPEEEQKSQAPGQESHSKFEIMVRAMAEESANHIESEMHKRSHNEGHEVNDASSTNDSSTTRERKRRWKQRDFSLPDLLLNSLQASKIPEKTVDIYKTKGFYNFSVTIQSGESLISGDTFFMRVIQDSNPLRTFSFHNIRVNPSNTLILEEPDTCVFDPVSRLPWVSKPEDLLGCSLLVEVFTEGVTQRKVAESVVKYERTNDSSQKRIYYGSSMVSQAEILTDEREDTSIHEHSLSPLSLKREELRKLRIQMRNNMKGVN